MSEIEGTCTLCGSAGWPSDHAIDCPNNPWEGEFGTGTMAEVDAGALRERAAIAEWLRADSAKTQARADKISHPAQRERLSGHAYILRFIAMQIEEGAHAMPEGEWAKQKAERLRSIAAPRQRGDEQTGGDS